MAHALQSDFSFFATATGTRARQAASVDSSCGRSDGGPFPSADPGTLHATGSVSVADIGRACFAAGFTPIRVARDPFARADFYSARLTRVAPSAYAQSGSFRVAPARFAGARFASAGFARADRPACLIINFPGRPEAGPFQSCVAGNSCAPRPDPAHATPGRNSFVESGCLESAGLECRCFQSHGDSRCPATTRAAPGEHATHRAAPHRRAAPDGHTCGASVLAGTAPSRPVAFS